MTQRMFTAVCFDMDGVLIQSREGIEFAWTTVARHHGIGDDQSLTTHGAAQLCADFFALPVSLSESGPHTYADGGLFIRRHAAQRIACS
jgi:sugar-phosphatase